MSDPVEQKLQIEIIKQDDLSYVVMVLGEVADEFISREQADEYVFWLKGIYEAGRAEGRREENEACASAAEYAQRENRPEWNEAVCEVAESIRARLAEAPAEPIITVSHGAPPSCTAVCGPLGKDKETKISKNKS